MTTDEEQVQCHMSGSDDLKSKNYEFLHFDLMQNAHQG